MKTETLNTSRLSKNLVVKNYRELCSLLDEDSKSGKSKTLQLEKFNRFFEYKKDGNKYIITNIFNIPKAKVDNRIEGNHSVYVQYIESLLLQLLAEKKNYELSLTPKKLWKELGMVNSKYGDVNIFDLQEHNIYALEILFTEFELKNFYLRTNSKLNQILKTSLDNLQKRKVIEWNIQRKYAIKTLHGYQYNIASSEETSFILKIEYELLNKFGCEDSFDLIAKGLQKKYYDAVSKKICDEFGWSFYFKEIHIIYCQDNAIKELEKSEIQLKNDLNDLIINAVNNSALAEYKRNLSKKMPKDKTGKEIPHLTDIYLLAQYLLAEELLRISTSNKKSLQEIKSQIEMALNRTIIIPNSQKFTELEITLNDDYELDELFI